MSIIWFVILSIAYSNGADIDNIAVCMVAIFYIGDCILLKNKKEK